MAQPPIVSSPQEQPPREKLVVEIAQKKIELEKAERELRAVTRPSEVKPKEEAIQKIQKQLEQLNIQNNDLLSKPAEAAPTPEKTAPAAFAGSPAVAEATEDATLIASTNSAGAVLSATTNANQKAAEDKKAAEKDAELKSAAAQASTLTSTGTAAKPQPILEAGTDEPKKEAEPKETEKFPQFPASGSWIKQLMWLLDILMFNSGIGRPPIIDKDKAKGFIQKLGEGFANLAADFKKKFSNAHRLISGTIGAAVEMTGNVIKGAGKVIVGGLQLAQGIIVTTVAAPLAALAAPLVALAAPKGQGLKAVGDVFGLVNQYGIKPLLKGGASLVDGLGNVLSVLPRGVVAVRDVFTGLIGMGASASAWVKDKIVYGFDSGEGPSEQWVKGKVATVDQSKKTSIFDKAALVLSGYDPEYPSLVDRLAGVVPKTQSGLATTAVATPNLGVQDLGVQAPISSSMPAPAPTVGTIAANVQSADVNYAAYQQDGRDVTPAAGSQGGGVPITPQLNAAESNAIHPLTALAVPAASATAAASPAPVVSTPVATNPDNSLSPDDPSSNLSSSPKRKLS